MLNINKAETANFRIVWSVVDILLSPVLFAAGKPGLVYPLFWKMEFISSS